MVGMTGLQLLSYRGPSAMAGDAPPRTTVASVTSWLQSLVARLEVDEPHATRGPLARWPHGSDVVVALVVFVLSVLFVTISALPDNQDLTLEAMRDHPWSALALLAASAAVLIWRRAHSVAVTAAVIGLLALWAVASHGDGQELALVVATYSLGRYAGNVRLSLALLGAAMLVDLGGTVIDPNQRIDILPAAVVAVVPWYVGRRVRNRRDYLKLLRERAERLEAEQYARAERAVAEERSRIARELHDVVAHRVSMMTVQAGAAKTIAGEDFAAAVDAMGDVELAGRQALGELRHLLGVLRPGVDQPEELGPQPGLADVPALVDQLVHTGAEVSADLVDPPAQLPAALELSAYRIIQESVTNIIRHAGPAPTVDIETAVDGRWLSIDISNTTSRPPSDMPTSGYGLLGMQERASLLGGTLSAGPQPPDRYRVIARLPLRLEAR